MKFFSEKDMCVDVLSPGHHNEPSVPRKMSLSFVDPKWKKKKSCVMWIRDKYPSGYIMYIFGDISVNCFHLFVRLGLETFLQQFSNIKNELSFTISSPWCVVTFENVFYLLENAKIIFENVEKQIINCLFSSIFFFEL